MSSGSRVSLMAPPTARSNCKSAAVALDRLLALAGGDLVLQALTLEFVGLPLGLEIGLRLGLTGALGGNLGVRFGLDLGLLEPALADEILMSDGGPRRLLQATGDLAGEAAAGALGDIRVRHVSGSCLRGTARAGGAGDGGYPVYGGSLWGEEHRTRPGIVALHKGHCAGASSRTACSRSGRNCASASSGSAMAVFAAPGTTT